MLENSFIRFLFIQSKWPDKMVFFLFLSPLHLFFLLLLFFVLLTHFPCWSYSRMFQNVFHKKFIHLLMLLTRCFFSPLSQLYSQNPKPHSMLLFFIFSTNLLNVAFVVPFFHSISYSCKQFTYSRNMFSREQLSVNLNNFAINFNNLVADIWMSERRMSENFLLFP
jgi:hypothetical protein